MPCIMGIIQFACGSFRIPFDDSIQFDAKVFINKIA